MNKKTYERRRKTYNCINVIALAIVISFTVSLAPALAKSVDANDLDDIRGIQIEKQSIQMNIQENLDNQAVIDYEEPKDELETTNIEGADESIEDSIMDEAIDEDDNAFNIVVFGDSIWDIERGETNIGNQLEKILEEKAHEQGNDIDVNIYNLAVGGTCAAIIEGPTDFENWNSQSLPGMIHVLDGDLDADKIYPEANMLGIYEDVNLEDTDLFIYAYGVNDYFFANAIESDDTFDLYTYKGSLRKTITDLQARYPLANHMIISPTYCQFYYYDEVIETCEDKVFYKNDNPGETLDNYVVAAGELAEELDISFLDAYHDFNLGADTQSVYSRDGIHFNEAGRLQYASCVAEEIISPFH